jgi:hypothetical protein
MKSSKIDAQFDWFEDFDGCPCLNAGTRFGCFAKPERTEYRLNCQPREVFTFMESTIDSRNERHFGLDEME